MGDYAAAEISATPSGGLAATTVQAALEELDTEKAPLASPAFTGTPTTPQLGVNTTADATNRLSVAGAATLLTHAGAGHQVKVNKAAAANTASVLYQSGFSGRPRSVCAETTTSTSRFRPTEPPIPKPSSSTARRER